MALAQYQKMRRLSLAVLLLAAFVLLLFVGASGNEEIHDMVEAIGLGFIVIGIIGRMWCTLYIGGRKSAEIVTTGPYSVTRNPLYVFSSIAAAGVGAQTGSVTIALLFLVGCAAAFHIVIVREESFLKDEFGTSYGRYRATVPRFLPKPSLFRDEAELRVQTKLVYRTLTDGLVFFVAMPVFELIELAQASGLLPVFLRLP
ncbi:isoprenylcysteine carboxylmethyltransferase family protein [Aurantimonas sp. C2-6-R+9]|uniref:methyltransferase family protein n=1 Tax=unclassified Aurantimonas TaxID=2638230 RepID=UPI002E19F77F|nr:MULTISPECIES: isoprenylcysteine carboxylmethyltransferase family protein [unclassified Aurantimonas]MEC5292050.1 isoprenylcysteine carboxylmethyltransferase family protein [Aurantimonas sp. C2-3-R2]MEC5382196.1 isoprenylcysteine carboxylmethyltransferase family protein [Aurantimonas sp. C2-6-R+9]MEC5413132.1 isoprenylcysteine carboxylmethyltransferase family protein [Aurantimonas sp. C2-4-R8]